MKYNKMTHHVAYNCFDEDKYLHVVKTVYKNDIVVFSGTEKECRTYIIKNQKKAKTPSLKRIFLAPKPK
jgi:hypothetical protein